MSDSELKKKMISLRLSDAEYATLKAQYRTHGARSISDLARLALDQIMHPTATSPYNLALKIADLKHRLQALEMEVAVILGRDMPGS
jgi:hypothetical protein